MTAAVALSAVAVGLAVAMLVGVAAVILERTGPKPDPDHQVLEVDDGLLIRVSPLSTRAEIDSIAATAAEQWPTRVVTILCAEQVVVVKRS